MTPFGELTQKEQEAVTYYMIEHRKQTLTPTEGSKRRCYDGCFHPDDWEYGWTNWDWLNLKLTLEQAKERLKFWEELSSGAGKPTQYRISVDTVYNGTW